MAADSLCIGDTVCLFSEEQFGFVYSFQSSSILSELAVDPRQDREKPNIPDPQVISFQISVANRYKLNKKLRKLQTKKKAALERGDDDHQLKIELAKAQISALAENEDNVAEQTRQQGKRLLYGQVIQLEHVFTKKFVHVSTVQTSRTESSNMQVDLCAYNAKQAQFRIMPRYKVKAEGDIVQVEDQIVLESIKSPGQYLHVSKLVLSPQSVYSQSHEVNLSVQQSGFTIYRRYKPEKDHANLLKENLSAGVPLRLFHKEIEAYLCVEGLFQDQVTEDVHLRVRQVDQNNPKTLFPSSSAITYWQIEMQEGPINGSVLRWEQQVRFKHMTTRKYLKVEANKTVTLTADHMDPKTVFRLHPVIKERDQIEFETYCRIEHVVTGFWLHAFPEDHISKDPSRQSQEEYERKQDNDHGGNDMSMAGLRWTKAQLKKIGVSEEMQYDDAFTLQRVEEEYVEIFNYMAGMVPFIQKIIKDKKAGNNLTAKQSFETVSALQEMKSFMILNSVPVKNRQKLMRNLRIVELLVSLLQIPYLHTPDQQHMTKILVECYDVLYTYLMGDSRKNELYIAKHIDFFERQINDAGDIGLNAAHMVMELVKDNRKIVDRITQEKINNYVRLLQKKKRGVPLNYRYLDLLSVLCVCDGVSIPDNQKYITEVWLMQGQRNCVYHTDLGQAIPGGRKEHNIVYVSKNNKHTWTALHDFVKGKNLNNDDEFLFLDHQLDLFGKLCYGRNEFAIKVITEDLGYLTWEEAFLCLQNPDLPDQLKAKYCHLIIGLFVDVGENTSILDRINLTFVYDDIPFGGALKSKKTSDEGETKKLVARQNSETMKYFPALRDWIASFLDANKDMTASLIGHNMLVEQVLRLVHYLVKYGYYGDIEDIKKLLIPLLSLLDGRNDKPHSKRVNHSIEDQQVIDHYRKELRYQQTEEAKAIVDAKHQAMEVLDLFFNFRFNTRLERFVSEFKKTHTEAHHLIGGNPELAPLLLETYDIYDNPSLNAIARERLCGMFAESAYLEHLDLTDVLIDLSNYQYDKMVTQSMFLLDRYYSSYDNLFKRAVQAQVLITEKSAEVLLDLGGMLPTMQRLVSAKMTQEQSKTMGDILDKMIKYCSLENEAEERHPMNQSILYNHGILGTVFDILSQEIDIRLMDQYSGIRDIFKKCFKLLQVMACGNEAVQQRLFDRMDMLLNIQGAEGAMAEALTEVFTGNKNTCMKILPHQIQKITALVAQHLRKAPQFLDLLNAVVKVEELNLPLKRNQGYVMKYFMQYRSEVAYVIDQEHTKREALLINGESQDLTYLISLVDLLATCAEGENRFIESICQTIFKIDELLDIINNPKIDSNLKRPYLRFFLWVYLNTAGGMIESGSGDLGHDKRIWEYFTTLTTEVNSLTTYVQSHTSTVKQLLKKAPSKSEEEGGSTTDIMIPMDDPTSLNEFLSEQEDGNFFSHHGTIHYLLEAVLPFMQVFFRTYYQPDRENFPAEADHLDRLTHSLVNLMDTMGPLISNPTHMKTMVGCMNVLLSASTIPVKVMEQFQDKYGGNLKVQDIRSDARKQYEEYYQAEEELNNHLNVFAINFSAAYGGFNDVHTQIGFNSDREYTEIDGDEEIPLGKEFQDHIACFIDTTKKGKMRYTRAGKLVEQLMISASCAHVNEKERLQQESLDIKCLQLLRGVIHNEIIKLPEDWEFKPTAHKKVLQRIESAQTSLNDHNAMLRVLPHLSKTGDIIIREVLAFLAAMLFGGNEAVQNSLIDYFLGTREEKFFFAIKNRMQLSAIATKEKRSLIAQHQAKVEEAIEQAKALRKAMKTGQMAAEEIIAANNMGSMLMASKRSMQGSAKGGKKKTSSMALKSRYGSKSYLGGSTAQLNKSSLLLTPGGAAADAINGNNMEMQRMSKKEDKQPLISKDNKVAPQENSEVHIEELGDEELRELAIAAMSTDSDEFDYKDDGYIELVLKILGLTCDGQNSTLQDYLREQPDNIKSVNLVAETARFLSLVYSSINDKTIGLITELFSTLVEFTSGNLQNQVVIFDNKVCDYINFILRGGQFQGCTLKEIVELKNSIATLIVSLTEENARKPKDPTGSQKPVGIAKEVMESLDADSIYGVIMDCYKKTQNNDSSSQLASDERDLLSSTGFRYYHILLRMMDLSDDVKLNKLLKSPEDQLIWEYFNQGTMSIEILKDDELHKIYFRCRDKSVLREDVKEKFKYEVDRSSPSNKLRDFMDWSQDIMADINYTKSVMANPISKFFIKHWYFFNMSMIFISFVFFVLIMVTWKAPVASTGNSTLWWETVKPDYAYDHVEMITYALGGIHNLFSICVLISYFITNHPTFPNFSSLRSYMRRIKHGDDDDDDDDEEEKVRDSNLEVKFFSFITMWYLMLFATSVLGTIFWGYFFAIHLLHMANFNQLLLRAIQAVTKNGYSLLWVFLYGVVVLYIYALIAFAMFPMIFNPDIGIFCNNFYECMVTSIRRGLIDGMYNDEFLAAPEGKPFSFHLQKAVFDVTFFIIITTIGLNIIFGIIVDTFSELRDNKWNVDNDMHSTCFICSRQSYDFEHHGGGFDHHVKKEHNKWAYLFFFIHLEDTRMNDYTALELYVHRLKSAENYEFFPLNRALTLQHEEDNNEIRLETLMNQVTYLVNKMKEEEAVKEKEVERKKQQEWQDAHRDQN